MRLRRWILAAVPVLAMTACTAKSDAAASQAADSPAAAAAPVSSGSTDAAVRQVIEAANAKYTDAVRRGDTTTIAERYADDAIYLPAEQAAWRGRDAIRQGFGREIRVNGVKSDSLTTEDVMVSGDLAVETGRYVTRMQPSGRSEITEKGKSITVWRRQADGTWKVVRDIWNSDTPTK